MTIEVNAHTGIATLSERQERILVNLQDISYKGPRDNIPQFHTRIEKDSARPPFLPIYSDGMVKGNLSVNPVEIGVGILYQC